MKRILITGAAGFVGTHLLEHLLTRKDRQIWCLAHHKKPLVPSDARRRVHLIQGSLLNPENVHDALRISQPDQIFHLAGQASVAFSWKFPKETFVQNVQGQFYLLEALRGLKHKPTVLITCSSDEYGHIHPNELPVREENPLRPLSPYAVSKVTQDTMAYQYFRAYGLKIIRTRAFNHTGPGRPDTYAISSFAKQVALIERGRQHPTLHVGDLSVKRDYLDVRDVVRAYTLAIDHGVPGEVYNICSGKAKSLRQILDMLLAHTTHPIRIVKDPKRIRPSDLPIVCGDPSKFRRLTGWRPEIPLKQTVLDLLEDWRRRA